MNPLHALHPCDRPLTGWLRAWVWGLALCVALMSVWDQAHRIAHFEGLEARDVHSTPEVHGQELHTAQAWSALVDSHEEGSEACQLLAQLCGDGGLPGVVPVVLPTLLPWLQVPFETGQASARSAAPFGARGPP